MIESQVMSGKLSVKTKEMRVIKMLLLTFRSIYGPVYFRSMLFVNCTSNINMYLVVFGAALYETLFSGFPLNFPIFLKTAQ